MSRYCLLALLLLALPVHGEPTSTSREALGEAFFFDPDLSLNRTQSCATCHSPVAGFVDPRDHATAGRAVSLGDDGHSLGVRNTPTLGYAAQVPPFQRKEDGEYAGGLFLDGRAESLQAQASGPLMSPVEMAMPDEEAVLARLREKPHYTASLAALFGEAALEDPVKAVEAVTESLAAYQESPLFNAYDSKYDRSLRGEYQMTDEEELGRILFFSQQFTNCNRCHQIQRMPGQREEVFSNFEYHNIGSPTNPIIRDPDNPDEPYTDPGLADNPRGDDAAGQRGKFRVPTLRNVAVTGPYLHNGVFEELRTVVLFYDKFNNPNRKINPETGEPWGEPEVAENLSLEDLEHGPGLDDRRGWMRWWRS